MEPTNDKELKQEQFSSQQQIGDQNNQQKEDIKETDPFNYNNSLINTTIESDSKSKRKNSGHSHHSHGSGSLQQPPKILKNLETCFPLQISAQKKLSKRFRSNPGTPRYRPNQDKLKTIQQQIKMEGLTLAEDIGEDEDKEYNGKQIQISTKKLRLIYDHKEFLNSDWASRCRVIGPTHGGEMNKIRCRSLETLEEETEAAANQHQTKDLSHFLRLTNVIDKNEFNHDKKRSIINIPASKAQKQKRQSRQSEHRSSYIKEIEFECIDEEQNGAENAILQKGPPNHINHIHIQINKKQPPQHNSNLLASVSSFNKSNHSSNLSTPLLFQEDKFEKFTSSLQANSSWQDLEEYEEGQEELKNADSNEVIEENVHEYDDELLKKVSSQVKTMKASKQKMMGEKEFINKIVKGEIINKADNIRSKLEKPFKYIPPTEEANPFGEGEEVDEQLNSSCSGSNE